MKSSIDLRFVDLRQYEYFSNNNSAAIPIWFIISWKTDKSYHGHE